MPRRRGRPAITDEQREGQLISLAMDLAEQQLADGTASSQVMTHFLKSGSQRERLERERLQGEVELLKAKINSMESAQNAEQLFAEAIAAMRTYSGQEPVYSDYDDDEDYY